MWNKSERQGKVDQAKGKIKQGVATLTGDDDLKAEGQVDEAIGSVEVAVGRTVRKTGNAIARGKKAIVKR